jgi:hypothetical protein
MRASAAPALSWRFWTGRVSPGGPCWCAMTVGSGPRSCAGTVACWGAAVLCDLVVRPRRPFSAGVFRAATCSSSSATSRAVSDSVFFFVSADVFLHGVWSLANSGLPENDPKIQSLSTELRARGPGARFEHLVFLFWPLASFQAVVHGEASFFPPSEPFDRGSVPHQVDAQRFFP